jgi:peptidoglycan/LPS O-acetylase OafA/YrhL
MSTTAPPITSPPLGGLAFRPDIAGLRAVAVGVDVFFVISGFPMTALPVKEIDPTGRVCFQVFYARRTRRFLPAAAVVLIATIVASKLLLAPLELPIL